MSKTKVPSYDFVRITVAAVATAFGYASLPEFFADWPKERELTAEENTVAHAAAKKALDEKYGADNWEIGFAEAPSSE